MSTDTRYTAADGVKWDNYHDAVINWVNGNTGHPGVPPPGYIESYRVRHPRAPIPSDFPRTEEAWRSRHAPAGNSDAEDCDSTAQRNAPAETGVFLPNDAFSTLLDHQAMMTHHVGQLAGARTAIPSAPRAMVRFHPQNYAARARFYGQKGGLVAAKGWKRHQVAKAAGKGKGKGKKVKAKWARARVASVKTETAEAGPANVVPENTPEPGELEVETVVPEDVFMADYDQFKDEEDDGAAGSLFSEGDDTVIIAAA
ncbi:hypothetical protein B0H12DRAFT_1068752 [Mycena haematopus]|nr:hypothetical protein B0H12DRAFT_1068752 [Mycena haematopus]